MKPKAPVTYQVSEQPSTRVREEEFAKRLRLARYLAGANLPRSRSQQQVREARTPKQERPGTKSTAKAKRETTSKKAQGEELAKERPAPGDRFTRCRHPVRGEVRSNGLRPVVRSSVRRWLNAPNVFAITSLAERSSEIDSADYSSPQSFCKKISLTYPV